MKRVILNFEYEYADDELDDMSDEALAELSVDTLHGFLQETTGDELLGSNIEIVEEA